MGKRGKLAIVFLWIPMASVSLIVLFGVLINYRKTKDIDKLVEIKTLSMAPKKGIEFYASLPDVLGSFTAAISTQDARPEIISQFLKSHESPIEPFADTIVTASDQHNIDYRLIASIAMCESNLGKRIPEDSYNAYGYAIYTGEQSGAVFDDWNHGINVMAEYLSEKYISQGLTTPDQIGPIYAPPSVNTGNSWAKCVNTYMDELR